MPSDGTLRARFTVSYPGTPLGFPQDDHGPKEWLYDTCPSLDVAHRWLYSMGDLTNRLRPDVTWDASIETRDRATGEWVRSGGIEIDDDGTPVIITDMWI